jgi:hypothetical protein
MRKKARNRPKCAIFVTCVLLLAELNVHGQGSPSRERDIEDSRANTSLIIADIRPKLFADLPRSEQQIYNEIQFSVSSDDKIMNAYATHKGGVRRVVLTEAIGRAIELNTDAYLMEQLYHMPGFLGNYMSVVCEQYQKNRKRYAEGLPPLRIASPYEFAHWSNNDWEKFYSDQDANKTRNIVVGAAFAFLLAHEVGHHIKGHVDGPPIDLAESRKRELEADAWAIDLLVRKNLNPVAGIIPLLFFYYTDQNPVSKETMSDHPADARRLMRMYEGLSERLPSFRPYLNGVDYETARKRVDFAISLLKEEIAAGEKGRTARGRGTTTAGGPQSFAAGSQTDFCNDLSLYVRSAANNFGSLQGASDPDGGGEAFFARRGIAGFTDCTVWIYRDRSAEPSASCDTTQGDLDGLRVSIQDCLGSQWSSRVSAGDYIFEGTNGVTIRLHRNSSGVSELWVESPSRD